MPVPDLVNTLVQRFDSHKHDYKRGRFNETQTRRELIDPLFMALGWDVDHHHDGPREVVHEDTVLVAGRSKAPDYGFYLDGRRQFFVEAKQPSVDLAANVSPALQVRRYGWSAKLPVSILTDFEEFAVYDTRKRPNKGDAPTANRLLYLQYNEYPTRWDEIAAIFGRDAVLGGSLDRFAEAKGGKRGTAEVDAEFLKEIEQWRDTLARNLALRNAGLSQRDLNFAVQKIIDRIIFLRIAEDRDIEPFGRLQSATEGSGVYQRLLTQFRQADARYNSGLFHFTAEKGRTGDTDTLTPGLTVDDKTLKDMVRSLYPPDSPYVFSVLPTEILGQVYEQFLGKVIRLTDGHRAKVEEKPEVRKAGGVYYTPGYIVDYIVQQTVGQLVEGHTPAPDGPVSRLRVLDPACGSGSFLIGAYQYLLDWHLQGYVESGLKKWQDGRSRTIFQTADETWHLTLDERKRILLDNIYGVDIDAQAVEVTKLSLLLKVLEADPNALSNQMAIFAERVLPDLGRNIKCGNSLIGPDYYDGRLLVDQAEALRVNPFDWRAEFPGIFAAGGFDAVIGNPPYVRPHNIPKDTKEYLWKYYQTFVAKADLYSCFMERSLSLTKASGRFSFIVPHTWTSLESFAGIREFILDNSNIQTLVQLPKKVFADATVETCIFVLRKLDSSAFPQEHDIEVEFLEPSGSRGLLRRFPQSDIASSHLKNFQLYATNENTAITKNAKSLGRPLGSLVEFVYGFKTADDTMFISSERRHPEDRQFIRSRDITRYTNSTPAQYVWYVPEQMTKHRRTARPGETARFEAEKIMVARMGKQLVATYDSGGMYVKDAMLLLAKDKQHSLKYMLGLLNSRFLNFYYLEYFVTIDVLKNALLSLPIRTIDFTNPADVARHDRMVALVEQMLDLHQRLAAEANPQMKTLLQRQIDATDRQIDRLVYELYELTAEEIAIVEGHA